MFCDTKQAILGNGLRAMRNMETGVQLLIIVNIFMLRCKAKPFGKAIAGLDLKVYQYGIDSRFGLEGGNWRLCDAYIFRDSLPCALMGA